MDTIVRYLADRSPGASPVILARCGSQPRVGFKMHRDAFRIVTLAMVLLAQAAVAGETRALHPTIRDQLGPVRVVVAFPVGARVYSPLEFKPVGAFPFQTLDELLMQRLEQRNSFDSVQEAGGCGTGGAPEELGAIPGIEAGELGAMLDLHDRLCVASRFREAARASAERAFSAVPWIGAARFELGSAAPDATVSGAVLVLRLTPLLAHDGRRVSLVARATLYHSELGPQFTKFRHKGKLSPVPWADAPLAATSALIWSTQEWTSMVPKSDADRAEERVAIDSWFREASAGASKLKLEKLEIERRKRISRTTGNMLSPATARAKSIAAWQADGGAWLGAQYQAALSDLLPKLAAQLAELAPAKSDPIATISH